LSSFIAASLQHGDAKSGAYSAAFGKRPPPARRIASTCATNAGAGLDIRPAPCRRAVDGSACIARAQGIECGALNTGALRRKPTVMPDSTLPPGDPLVLRSTTRKTSEQGVGAWRRISPGEAKPPLAALAALARAQRSANGPLAQAERGGTRWRDIEWVDFTTDPDSGSMPSPDTGAPNVPALTIEADNNAPTAEPPVRTATAGVGDVLRHFAKRLPAPSAASIPGLAPRFSRVPVWLAPRPALPKSPGGIAQLAPARKAGSVVVHPRLPAAATPERRRTVSTPAPEPPPPVVPAGEPLHPAIAKPAPEPAPPVLAVIEPVRPTVVTPAAKPPPLPPKSIETPAPGAAAAPSDRESFPAAIYTSSSASPPRTETPPLRAALTARLGRAGVELRGRSGLVAAVLRDKSGLAAAALTGGLDRATTAFRAKLPRDPVATLSRLRPRRQAAAPAEIPAPAPNPPAAPDQPSLRARLAGLLDRAARRVAGIEPRMRMTGLVALTAVSVAVAAYLGGALIAGLAGTAPRPGNAKQPPTLTQPIPAVRAAVPPAAPPPQAPANDPASRAGFYLARAKAGDAAAQYDVGVLYARGDGLVQDYASAASWFHAAAAQGNVAAEYNLGVLYDRGFGVAADEAEALNWYRSAADQNHAGAQFNLALAYAEGRGTQQDFAAASRWYLRAAQQGLVPAMVNLAILYEGGSGVEKSPIEAYAWYSAAGDRSDAAAKDRAGELFRQFGDRDVARAQGLAATIAAALDAKGPKA
jgi:TPR repeat protein